MDCDSRQPWNKLECLSYDDYVGSSTGIFYFSYFLTNSIGWSCGVFYHGMNRPFHHADGNRSENRPVAVPRRLLPLSMGENVEWHYYYVLCSMVNI